MDRTLDDHGAACWNFNWRFTSQSHCTVIGPLGLLMLQLEQMEDSSVAMLGWFVAGTLTFQMLLKKSGSSVFIPIRT